MLNVYILFFDTFLYCVGYVLDYLDPDSQHLTLIILWGGKLCDATQIREKCLCYGYNDE